MVNGSGGSAVVIASRGGNGIMRKLETITIYERKIFAKSKKESLAVQVGNS